MQVYILFYKFKSVLSSIDGNYGVDVPPYDDLEEAYYETNVSSGDNSSGHLSD